MLPLLQLQKYKILFFYFTAAIAYNASKFMPNCKYMNLFAYAPVF